MEDIELFEEKEKQNRERNKKYIKEFKDRLKDNSFSEKTIKRHIKNIDLFINEYLNYYEITKMEDGIKEVNSFLDSWFIEKCLATKSSVKEEIASIKKFYKCMCEKNYVNEIDYKSMCEEIKENMEIYLEQLKAYENGSYYNMF